MSRRYKLNIELEDMARLSPENQANEELAIELAQKIFDLITDEKYLVAHGARALDFTFRALVRMDAFSKSFSQSAEVNNLASEVGRLKIEILPRTS